MTDASKYYLAGFTQCGSDGRADPVTVLGTRRSYESIAMFLIASYARYSGDRGIKHLKECNYSAPFFLLPLLGEGRDGG